MLFSIIVPVYNLEKCLQRGLDCLINQTYGDFEVLLINDGSTDRSGLICDNIVAEDSRFRVIHQKNVGPGGARNVGIENAKGDYLAFYDADDVVSNSWLQKMCSHISNFNPDLLIYGYEEIDTKCHTSNTYRFEPVFYPTNSDLRIHYLDTLSPMKLNNGFVWNKIYRRDFILKNKLWFENLRIRQDEVFNLQVYPLAERVVVTDDVPYTYFVYYSGNNRSKYMPDRLDIYRKIRDAFVDFMRIWDIATPEFSDYVDMRFFVGVIHYINVDLYERYNVADRKSRRKAVAAVMGAEDVKELLKRMEERGNLPHSFFPLRFFKALKAGSVLSYERTGVMESRLRKLKDMVRGLKG